MSQSLGGKGRLDTNPPEADKSAISLADKCYNFGLCRYLVKIDV